MLWKYGGSLIASMPDNRYIVCSGTRTSIAREPEHLAARRYQFAGHHPAGLQNFERYDISEWAASAATLITASSS
jgi:hypothetical protein